MKKKRSALNLLVVICAVLCCDTPVMALDVNVPPLDLETAISQINSSTDTENNIFITSPTLVTNNLTQIIKNVVISAEGPSRTAINLGGHSGFWLHGGNTTGMRNLVISNGVNPASSPIAGGAVFVEGTLDMNNMEFISNTDATGRGGGAINNSADSMLRIENSTFTNNSETSTSPNTGGGAINNSAAAYVGNSTFLNNSSGSQGGAIYNNGQNSSLESFNNTYGQNTATNEGGAIYSNDGRISSNNDQFHYNTAQLGGAVYYNGSGNQDMSLVYDTFENNGTQGDSQITYYGGALYQTGNSALSEIRECLFQNNNADWGGGAIYITMLDGGSHSATTINDSTFTYNKGNGYFTDEGGGAILITNGATVQIGFNNNFSGNEAENGGHIYNSGSNLSILENNVFSQGTSSSNGGAIANISDKGSSANLTIERNNTFDNNTSVANGGAIYQNTKNSTDPSASTTIDSNNSFTNNYASQNGGAIFSNGTLNIAEYNHFENNTAENGAAIYNDKGLTQIADSYFVQNNSRQDGGAIYTNNDSQTILSGNNFNSNYASGNGGALFINSTGSVQADNGTTFRGNSAQNGGAVYNAGEYNTSSYISYNSNSASNDGGAIYTLKDITITSSSFSGNKAAQNGGAILMRPN